MVEGSWGAEFYEGLGPLGGETVVKHTRVNAFFGSPLEEILRILDARRLIMAGSRPTPSSARRSLTRPTRAMTSSSPKTRVRPATRRSTTPAWRPCGWWRKCCRWTRSSGVSRRSRRAGPVLASPPFEAPPSGTVETRNRDVPVHREGEVVDLASSDDPERLPDPPGRDQIERADRVVLAESEGRQVSKLHRPIAALRSATRRNSAHSRRASHAKAWRHNLR